MGDANVGVNPGLEEAVISDEGRLEGEMDAGIEDGVDEFGVAPVERVQGGVGVMTRRASLFAIPAFSLALANVARGAEQESREAKFARLKKEGLEKIKAKEDYTYRFYDGYGEYNIMAVRFERGKATLFIRTIIGDTVKGTEAYSVDTFESWMDTYKRGGWTVDEL